MHDQAKSRGELFINYLMPESFSVLLCQNCFLAFCSSERSHFLNFKFLFIKPGRCVPGFLRLLSCGRRYVCVCVSTPQANKNNSREMKPE